MIENKIKKHNADAPHSDFVGSLIAFVVVSIVMNGIFDGQWFAIIPQVVLFIVMIRNGINYLQFNEERKTYQYHTSQDDLWGIWIAAIIVNITMAAIFHGLWVGKIAAAVLNIKAIEITITYILTEKQRKLNKIATNSYVNTPVSVMPIYQTSTVSQNSNYSEVQYSSVQFCHNCGEKIDNTSKFCAYCGAQLN